ncbi:hypothetical protein BJ138DRAFT_1019438, partial [Hygrophoropsis aurantiaca]
VPLDYFQEAFLPPLQISADALKVSLTNEGVLNQVGRWTHFPNNPAADPQREEPAFEPLEAIFGAVIRLAQPLVGRGPTLEFRRNPTVPPQCTRTNTSRPDAYMLVLNKKSVDDPTKPPVDLRVSWDDIAVSLEYKKKHGADDRDDNDEKIIWSLHHVMRSDPCRRATFGVTIEDTRTRFWFTCRSATIVSEEFNFIENTAPLTHFFCALAFAEEHQQGWDPTCRRVWDELFGIQYDIEFRDAVGKTRVYRTTRVLSDFGAEALRGHGTRVFEAYLTGGKEEGREDKTQRVAIKDAWRDSDRLREDQILRGILKDVKEKNGTHAAEEAGKYFLTVHQAEDVQIGGMTDHTFDLLFHGHAIPPDYSYIGLKSEKELSHTLYTPSVGNVPLLPTRGNPVGAGAVHKIQHKIHFRIVFDEVCEPTYKLDMLAVVFSILYDAAQVFKILHNVGWVHRDVSIGNVLYFNGRVKLSDLEYAKKMGTDSGHEVCTGTVNFMACEIEGQRYLFYKTDAELKEKYVPAEAAGLDITCPSRPEFSFNPLHDLEALCWIAVWILFYHIDKDNPGYSARQRIGYDTLFPGIITRQTHLSALTSRLETEALPERFRDVCAGLELLRQQLVGRYRDAEKTYPINLTLEGLQNYYLGVFGDLPALCKDVRLSAPSAG